uniref:ATP synthase mitochondrial F1 complex assembly factor 2-like n=1 Tax=Styela clava TaxID=7725 RepID=UPI00193A96F0|nr:ATP synthase mitochondrial F1 complex assembly factor 2-like [Styela clava]
MAALFRNLVTASFTCSTTVHCNVLSILRRHTSVSGRKKFFKEVTISCDSDGYDVSLDKRKLKCPSGIVLRLPCEQLAQAVALEWDSQRDALKYHTMPITNLCFYAMDKPNGEDKATLVDICLNFLRTDTVLFHSDEPPGLGDHQVKEWGKIIDWARQKYNVELNYTSGFTSPHLPEETINTFEKYLLSYNFWAVTGFERLLSTLKSLLLSIALVERSITVEEAVSLSRLEQEYQISQWGNVEWHHDIDLLESRKSAAACAIFIHACSEDSRYINLQNLA